MKKIFTATALIISSPAMADSWTGFYTGINAGYGSGLYETSEHFISTFKDNSGSGSAAVARNSSASIFANGGTIGGTIGFNKQFASRLVLGVEADMNYSNISDNAIYQNQKYDMVYTGYGNNSASGYSGYSRTSLDWYGTVRGRLGYSFGAFMPYLTGGLAFGSVSSKSNTSGYSALDYGNIWSNNMGNTNVGYAFGAGLEYKLTDNVSVKAEYLRTEFNGPSNTYTQPVPNNYGTVLETTSNSIKNFGVNHVRAGINYRFNFGN